MPEWVDRRHIFPQTRCQNDGMATPSLYWNHPSTQQFATPEAKNWLVYLPIGGNALIGPATECSSELCSTFPKICKLHHLPRNRADDILSSLPSRCVESHLPPTLSRVEAPQERQIRWIMGLPGEPGNRIPHPISKPPSTVRYGALSEFKIPCRLGGEHHPAQRLLKNHGLKQPTKHRNFRPHRLG